LFYDYSLREEAIDKAQTPPLPWKWIEDNTIYPPQAKIMNTDCVIGKVFLSSGKSYFTGILRGAEPPGCYGCLRGFKQAG